MVHFRPEMVHFRPEMVHFRREIVHFRPGKWFILDRKMVHFRPENDLEKWSILDISGPDLGSDLVLVLEYSNIRNQPQEFALRPSACLSGLRPLARILART